MKNKQTKTNKGPGRPSYQIKWPRGRFTFAALCVLNGVDPDTGKGANCTKLTLRNHLKSELYNENGNPRRNSLIVLTDDTKKPTSESGLGRRQLVYARRDSVTSPKANKTSAATLADVSVPIATSEPATEATPATAIAEPQAEVATVQTEPAVVAAPVESELVTA